VKVPPSWGEGTGSVWLGDNPQGSWRCLLYPLGMLPNTHGRYLNTPIEGIGTSDERYLKQMEALIDPIKGFN